MALESFAFWNNCSLARVALIIATVAFLTRILLVRVWSEAIYNHPSNVDGLIYMSRLLTTEKAVVLFDRATAKIQAGTSEGLTVHNGWTRAARSLGIRGIW
jgi:hypothetical protein